jgi:hypothetical protein
MDCLLNKRVTPAEQQLAGIGTFSLPILGGTLLAIGSLKALPLLGGSVLSWPDTLLAVRWSSLT